MQTSAVDIWSLGVVVLVLLTTGTEVGPSDFSRLDRLDQGEIETCLRHVFSKMSKQPSSNAKRFLWDCLQATPSKRVSAFEAESHEWLSTPKKYLDFFRQLDRKMLSEWKQPIELKPMPWEIPSLLKGSPPSSRRGLRLYSDQCTQPDGVKRPPNSRETTGSSPFFQKQDVANPLPVGTTSEESLIGPKSFYDTVSITPTISEVQIDEQPRKQTQPPWAGVLKPSRLPSHPPQVKRKKIANFKISDAALLPLTGLDRHLRPRSKSCQRQQILRELKKRDTKFLVDALPLVPHTPPSLSAVQMPAAPKKKGKRDAIGKLSGPHH